MRKLFLFFLWFSSLSCFAQNDWAPIGAKWWYGTHDIPLFGPPPYAVGYYTTEVIGETIIDGKTCREITTNVCSICPNACYIYSDSNRVYYYSGAEFFLLYDMNLNPGQGWELYYFPQGGGFDSISIAVTDTFSTEVSGKMLKTQQISVTSGNLEFGSEIIEIIGNTYSFFPIDYGSCDAGFDDLRCYNDSINEIYMMDGNCEYTDVGILENEISDIKFFPNPANNIATIEFENLSNSAFTLRIIDITGRVVIEKENIRTSRIEVNSQTLPPGIYQYEIVSEKEHKQSMGKFVVN